MSGLSGGPAVVNYTTRSSGVVEAMKRERKTLDWDDYTTFYPDKPGAFDGPRVLDAPAGDSASPGLAVAVSGSGDGDDNGGRAVTAVASSDPEGVGGVSNLAFHAAVDRLYGEASNLLIRKHHDYGPKNIAEAPGGALNGLLVRMHDKQARLNHLWYMKAGTPAVNESLEDTLIDLANYSLIAVMVLRGQWPGAE